MVILSITAPIYILIALGYVAARAQVLAPVELRGMGIFVLNFALPALLFQALSRHPAAQVFDPKYLLAYGLGSLIVFAGGLALAKWRGQTLTASAVNALGMTMSNAGFVGYPLMVTVIGERAALFMAQHMLIENLLILPLFLVLVESAGSRGKPLGETVRGIVWGLLKNPMILAIAAGLAVSVGQWRVPMVVDKTTAMLAAASAPIALFIMGGRLFGLKLAGSRVDIAHITLGKLLFHPLLVVALLYGLGADGQTLFIAAMFASVPMASVYPIIGQAYGHERRTAAAMLIVTLASFFTTSGILWGYPLLSGSG